MSDDVDALIVALKLIGHRLETTDLEGAPRSAADGLFAIAEAIRFLAGKLEVAANDRRS